MILLAIVFTAVAVIAFVYGYRTLRLDLTDSTFMAVAVTLALGALVGGTIYVGHLF